MRLCRSTQAELLRKLLRVYFQTCSCGEGCTAQGFTKGAVGPPAPTAWIASHFGLHPRVRLAAERLLADVVVAFTAPNMQNLNGTIMMAESIRRKEVFEARNGKPDVVLVPTRIDSAELDSRN